MRPEGYTVSELMEKTNKTRQAIESWISRHKVKPLTQEAVYPPEILEQILKSKRGRPATKPKAKPEDPAKAAKPKSAKK